MSIFVATKHFWLFPTSVKLVEARIRSQHHVQICETHEIQWVLLRIFQMTLSARVTIFTGTSAISWVPIKCEELQV